MQHGGSVSALTDSWQADLQMAAHHAATVSRDLATPADRIRWAIEQSGHRLIDVAIAVGCSHSALSQWQTGATQVENIKVGLLLKFCDFTGASLQWLLTGDGPRLMRYAKPFADSALVQRAAHIARDLPPEIAAVAERVLKALEPPPKTSE